MNTATYHHSKHNVSPQDMDVIEGAFRSFKQNLLRSFFQTNTTVYLLEIVMVNEKLPVIVALEYCGLFDEYRVSSGYLIQNQMVFRMDYWKAGRASNGWTYKDRKIHLRLIEKWQKKITRKDFDADSLAKLKWGKQISLLPFEEYLQFT